MHSRRALLCLRDPSISSALALHLLSKGWQLIASDETRDYLQRQGITVQSLSEFLGYYETHPFPPTLHPKIEGALTTQCPEKIDLLWVQPYGFEQGVDIGGHTLVGLGIKGNRWVLVDEEDAKNFSLFLNGDGKEERLRRKLRMKAIRKLVEFYTEIEDNELPTLSLQNGENPYEVPAYLRIYNEDEPLGMGKFALLSSTSPCFTNLADLDNLTQVLIMLSKIFETNFSSRPKIAIAAKHGNPCGVGVDWDSQETALEKALWGNARGIWGGEFICNFEINPACAQLLMRSSERVQRFGAAQWMLDLVAAPAFETNALECLRKRNQRRVFQNPNLIHPEVAHIPDIRRSVRGGALCQPGHTYILKLPDLILNEHSLATDLSIAWAVAAGSFHGGNEVALVKEGQLFGVGGGPSTIEAAQTAIERATSLGHNLRGSVFAADAFFPCTDAPLLLCDAGSAYGVVPRGGQRFLEVEALLQSKGVRCIFLDENIRGFCRH